MGNQSSLRALQLPETVKAQDFPPFPFPFMSLPVLFSASRSALAVNFNARDRHNLYRGTLSREGSDPATPGASRLLVSPLLPLTRHPFFVS